MHALGLAHSRHRIPNRLFAATAEPIVELTKTTVVPELIVEPMDDTPRQNGQCDAEIDEHYFVWVRECTQNSRHANREI